MDAPELLDDIHIFHKTCLAGSARQSVAFVSNRMSLHTCYHDVRRISFLELLLNNMFSTHVEDEELTF